MKLAKLFKLIEITRAHPQYGYSLAGIPKYEQSDLAQHHFLVTFFAWRIARTLIQNNIKIDVEKVLEFSLIHDIGELFGGDISMPYAHANPIAKKYAKAFEEENQRFISKFFDQDEEYIKSLAKEILDAQSLEAIVSKIGDYMEVTHYKEYLGMLTKGDITMAVQALTKKIEILNNKKTKQILHNIVNVWSKDITSLNGKEIFENDKLKSV